MHVVLLVTWPRVEGVDTRATTMMPSMANMIKCTFMPVPIQRYFIAVDGQV